MNISKEMKCLCGKVTYIEFDEDFGDFIIVDCDNCAMLSVVDFFLDKHLPTVYYATTDQNEIKGIHASDITAEDLVKKTSAKPKQRKQIILMNDLMYNNIPEFCKESCIRYFAHHDMIKKEHHLGLVNKHVNIFFGE